VCINNFEHVFSAIETPHKWANQSMFKQLPGQRQNKQKQMRCFCNNTLQNASTNASEEKHVELNISTKQVCQQHVPNICILGTIVELLLHSKVSCRNRKFNIMRGERTAGKCIKKIYKKWARRKIIFTEPCVTVNTTIYFRKGVCVPNMTSKHISKHCPRNKNIWQNWCLINCVNKRLHGLYLANANIEEHCLIKFSSKMCPQMPPRTLLVHMNTWKLLLN